MESSTHFDKRWCSLQFVINQQLSSRYHDALNKAQRDNLLYATSSMLLILAVKDTHSANAPQNKTQTLNKKMNMNIWVVGTLKSTFYKRF